MADLIDRQAAIDFIAAGHLCNPNEPRWSDNEVVNFLKSRPSAQPNLQPTCNQLATDCISILSEIRSGYSCFDSERPYYHALSEGIKALNEQQRTGRWIPVAGRMGKEVQCDCCGEVFWYWLTNFTYCPNCGAKMEVEHETD